jgi:hypothetical protein
MQKEHLRHAMDSANRARVWSLDSGMEDSRKTLRYEVRARAVFHWDDRGGVSREGQGFTKNVSPKGAYVLASECPPQGTPMEMTIDLPSLGKGSNNLHIRADCHVLRVDRVGTPQGTIGFSVRNSRVTLGANQ